MRRGRPRRLGAALRGPRHAAKSTHFWKECARALPSIPLPSARPASGRPRTSPWRISSATPSLNASPSTHHGWPRRRGAAPRGPRHAAKCARALPSTPLPRARRASGHPRTSPWQISSAPPCLNASPSAHAGWPRSRGAALRGPWHHAACAPARPSIPLPSARRASGRPRSSPWRISAATPCLNVSPSTHPGRPRHRGAPHRGLWYAARRARAPLSIPLPSARRSSGRPGTSS
mmetsp:Transcript_1663/g.4043  ORF Transcript_1663/g.4043 Transcript_1663/m.4043 type:complete len:233 (+) Transcript_1663:1403-2101(+)